MKSFLAGLLLVLVALLSPISAGATPDQMTLQDFEYMAKSVGCDADLKIVRGSLNGLAIPGGVPLDAYGNSLPRNFVLLRYEGWEDPDAVKLVALHELAHCLQFDQKTVNSRFLGWPTPWMEFEADALALEWAPRFGVTNLRADIDSLIDFTRDRDPHAGWDKPHGSPAGRILFNEWQLRRLHPEYGIQGA